MLGDSSVALTVSDQGYRIDNTYSYHALTRMNPNPRAQDYVLGVTRAVWYFQYQTSGSRLVDKASGYECMAPRVKMALYFTPIVIYVGREFKPATCAYEQILAHEMRHLNTYLEHLPKVEVTVRAALEKRFGKQPLYAKAGQAEGLMTQELNTEWRRYVAAEMARVAPLQAAIDTPKEYARLSKVCKGEVQSLIGPVKRTRR